MPEKPGCQVQKLIRSLCNEDCLDWGTCPISKMLLKTAVNLFESYDPKHNEVVEKFHRKYGGNVTKKEAGS